MSRSISTTSIQSCRRRSEAWSLIIWLKANTFLSPRYSRRTLTGHTPRQRWRQSAPIRTRKWPQVLKTGQNLRINSIQRTSTFRTFSTRTAFYSFCSKNVAMSSSVASTNATQSLSKIRLQIVVLLERLNSTELLIHASSLLMRSKSSKHSRLLMLWIAKYHRRLNHRWMKMKMRLQPTMRDQPPSSY